MPEGGPGRPAGGMGAGAPSPYRLNGPSGRFFALIWLAYLIYPLVDLLGAHVPLAERVIGCAGLAAFVLIYAWAWSPSDGWWNGQAPLALAAAFVLALGLTLLAGPACLGLFVFCSPLAAGRLRSLPLSIALIAGNIVICVGLGIRLHTNAGDLLSLGLACALSAAAVLGMRRLQSTSQTLRAAQEEIARLAVVEERLRIARDVHDLLGHSLSVVALKADLAGRLLPGDPGRAAAEITDVQQVARRALREVREAVAGYRRLRLDEELARARAALEAAGIGCVFTRMPDELPPEADSVLSWAVREAVTNVLRHSRARTCQIQIAQRQDRVEAVIEDDGVGEGSAGPDGSGLAGLGERLQAAGGDVEAGPRPGGGFRVVAWLPAQGGREAPAPEGGRAAWVSPASGR